MPTDKKRINLTVPDEIYERIQAYKKDNGIMSDATACLQLVTQQLINAERGKAMMDLIQQSNMDDIMSLSQEGFDLIKKLKK